MIAAMPATAMPAPLSPARRRLLQSAALAPLLPLAGCAALPGRPAPRVDLAGLEPLPGEGLELRFLLKLRVQNPGDADLRYDGLWAEVELRGQRLASGGAPLAGVVPRYGEAVLALPVTASGLALARQALAWMRAGRDGPAAGPVAYALRGRLGGVGLGGLPFETRGEIDLAAGL